MKLIATLTAATLIFSTVPVFAADDVMDRIRQLEQQIQELKQLKEQQLITEAKSDDCMKAIAREKFCSCISTSLPRDVSFEQYVHTMVTPKDTLGYSAMPVDQRQKIDATLTSRDNCIEKGFFK